MKKTKYFIQFVIIILLFSIFKIFGLKISSIFSGLITSAIGPLFRSNKICHSNLLKALPEISENARNKIIKKMWFNYGRILAEYMFIKDFRTKTKFSKKIIVENQEILEKIKKDNKPVIFVSGHFNNFELMAMHIEKSGINLAAVYRPLNNKFLNPLMEKIRKKYICKNQIKKGIGGLKKLLLLKKKNVSTALMIDQRVSEGVLSNFFNEKALTTTIPAQLVKKFDIPVIPIYIERLNGINFKITINEPIKFPANSSVESITEYLNKVLEKMIMKKPESWIWSHNRWK